MGVHSHFKEKGWVGLDHSSHSRFPPFDVKTFESLKFDKSANPIYPQSTIQNPYMFQLQKL